jgi:hypothetical protein
LLLVLLIGLGALIYWQFGDQLLGFFNSSTDGTTPPPVADVTKPEITFPVEPTIGATSVSILWHTDELSSSQVEYGLETTYGSLFPTEPDTDPTVLGDDEQPLYAGVIDHSVILTPLIPNTTYHYRVKSKDAAGNESISPDKTFTTAEVEVP